MRARTRLLATTAVALGLLVVAVAPPAPAVADLGRTQQELDQVTRDLESIVRQLDEIADEIEAIDRRLGTANAELRNIRADLAVAETGIGAAQAAEAAALARIEEAEQRLAEVQVEIVTTRERLQGRLVQTFKYGRTTSVDIVMRGTVGALDLHELALTLSTIGRITDDDRGLVAAMESLAVEQEALIVEQTAARVAAVEARDAAVRQRNRIAELEAEQRRVVATINSDRARRKAVFDELDADKSKLAALAAALAEEIRRLQLANLSVIMPVGGVFVGVPDWAPRLPVSGQPYSALVASAAATQGVDGRLLAALVWSESAFRPNAVSRAGAAGLSQLMPATARGLGLRVDSVVDERFDPERNLNAGARYLRAQIVRFGSVELGLAAYNAGPGNVVRYGGIPPFAETQFYVYIVMRRYATIVG
jgi:soluble lytic murein transglycosylase-like protein/flagellar biosynthesis chaperone FliJ